MSGLHEAAAEGGIANAPPPASQAKDEVLAVVTAQLGSLKRYLLLLLVLVLLSGATMVGLIYTIVARQPSSTQQYFSTTTCTGGGGGVLTSGGSGNFTYPPFSYPPFTFPNTTSPSPNTSSPFANTSIAYDGSNKGVLVDPSSGRPVKVNLNLEPFALSSNLPFQAFQQLTSFTAKSPTGKIISVQVEGFSITPPPSFNPGNPPQVDLYTFFGTITLYGTTLTFANTVPDVFVELGFTSGPLGASDSSSSSSSSSSGGGNTNLYATTTTTTRRKLLGIAELVGFFNFLNTASWNSHVASGANSSLPMTNFTPSLPPLLQTFSRTYFPCVSPLCQGVTAVDGSLVAPTVGVRTYQGTLYQFYDENGYSSTDNVTGVTSYVAQRTYEMWPGVTLVELSNGTATKVNYLTANGSNYNYREIPVVSLTNSSNSTNGSTVLLDQNARYTRKVEQTGQSETVSVDVYATTSTAGNLTNQFFYYSAAGDVSIAVLLIAKVSDGTTPLATYSNGYVTGGDVITEFYLYQPLNAIDTSLFSTAGIQASVLAPDTYFTPPDIAAYSVGAVANAPDPAWGTLVPTNYTNSSSTSGRRLLTCSDSSKVAGNLFGSITGTYHCLANTFDISGVTGSSAFTTTPVSLANKPVGASGAGSIGTFDCGYVMGKLGLSKFTVLCGVIGDHQSSSYESASGWSGSCATTQQVVKSYTNTAFYTYSQGPPSSCGDYWNQARDRQYCAALGRFCNCPQSVLQDVYHRTTTTTYKLVPNYVSVPVTQTKQAKAYFGVTNSHTIQVGGALLQGWIGVTSTDGFILNTDGSFYYATQALLGAGVSIGVWPFTVGYSVSIPLSPTTTNCASGNWLYNGRAFHLA